MSTDVITDDGEIVEEHPPVQLPVPTKDQPVLITTDAKSKAVADLTTESYKRASTLQLSKEENEGLLREFPDDAFRQGAAGKQNLIYIEHSHLRNRLNEVLGLGQWALVPRSRWSEDFQYTDSNGNIVKATRIYVEAMLLIRGCFVGEAIGDMAYYPTNPSQNYGDAVEGAKTAALRRCAKELGIGLQAWDKTWCEGWWARKAKKPPPGRNHRPDYEPDGERPPEPKPEQPPRVCELVAKWPLPATGPKLWNWVYFFDQKLAEAKKCQQGDLVKYVREIIKSRGLSATMATWEDSMVANVRESLMKAAMDWGQRREEGWISLEQEETLAAEISHGTYSPSEILKEYDITEVGRLPAMHFDDVMRKITSSPRRAAQTVETRP